MHEGAWMSTLGLLTSLNLLKILTAHSGWG